ncbi:hypothetical protein L228DRAFT_77830 [Xylona heveae TC161]|uniref:Uncharacterized protein n=1 Tax=Xylona heveae (strain CBS 132557 / TC161) TaxID=1328760 RepID=A0A165IXB9_XYLHT|nr:hypothetical protein L228DRAFT_77830 [Xylona heveae TC161]KZF25503.1 hypothetical protein L228DRAFT_77830 [Xylona heveae TC161]
MEGVMGGGDKAWNEEDKSASSGYFSIVLAASLSIATAFSFFSFSFFFKRSLTPESSELEWTIGQRASSGRAYIP